jgi:hypothetical protein
MRQKSVLKDWTQEPSKTQFRLLKEWMSDYKANPYTGDFSVWLEKKGYWNTGKGI